MDILIFNWKDVKNPNAGGAEVYTHEIMRRLADRGHNVALFTSKFKGCTASEVVDGVEIIREGNSYTVYLKARNFCKKHSHKYDVVIDEINTRPFFVHRWARSKTFALIHQLAREFWFYEMPFPLDRLGYHLLEYRWLREYADVPTITVSDSTKNDLMELGFRRVFVVHNGLNVPPLTQVPEKEPVPTVVFVGRMRRAKKPDDVLKAFRIVKNEVRDARLWMVGDGYMRKRLELKARKTRDIRFFGYVDNRIKNELVKRAWVMAVPGVREGWGQVVTDANALGTPAVGYDIHGLRDSIVHEHTGLLVDTDPEALAEGLIKILSDKNLRTRMSKNALKWARQFSWDKSAEEFEKVITEVVNSGS